MRSHLRLGLGVLVLGVAIAAFACTDDDGSSDTDVATAGPSVTATATARAEPTTPPEQVVEDIEVLMTAFNQGLNPERVARIGRSGDIRDAWPLADLMQFFPRGQTAEDLNDAWREVTGVPTSHPRGWQASSDYLIANDIDVPDGYIELKLSLLGLLGRKWGPFFDDPNGDVDWRLISWGGVGIDDRSYEQPERDARTRASHR